MRSTRTQTTHQLIADRLPQRLGRLLGDEPGTRTVIVIVDSETAAELGLVTPARVGVIASASSTRAGRRADLARRRHDLGLTQEGLAREIGVQPSTVGRWERAVTMPSLWAREQLCRVLDVSRAELDVLLGEDSAEPIRALHVVEPSDDTDAEGPALASGIA
jgi:DNA-binding XRE family transcriptional regulator